jgi:hypothetical protein
LEFLAKLIDMQPQLHKDSRNDRSADLKEAIIPALLGFVFPLPPLREL